LNCPLKLIQSLKRLETPDGAWSNVPNARTGATNATAGAVTLIRHLGFPVNDRVGDWLWPKLIHRAVLSPCPARPRGIELDVVAGGFEITVAAALHHQGRAQLSC
jgi:hypothetical protein